jgi:hypothetical protein
MSSVLFIPVGEMTDDEKGGVVNSIGDNEEGTQDYTVRNDNHQRTFLVKNDDGSLEVFNVLKRTTADLVLPDNRMPTITLVDYHTIFKKIPIDTFGLGVIIGTDLSIKDALTNTMNTINSVKEGGKYRYIIFNSEYKPKRATKEIEIPDGAIMGEPGNYLLSLLQRDIPDITSGYITLIQPPNTTDDELQKWFESSITNRISISKEDEKPIVIQMAERNNGEDDSKESSEKTHKESTEHTKPTETTKPTVTPEEESKD